jgi:UDP-galactopyranose mutase
VYYLRKKGISDIAVIERSKVGGCAETRFYHRIPYEFGPQVMYTDEDRLQRVFEEFLTCYPPPTPDGRFHPALSVDGSLNNGSVHSFPVTVANVLMLPNPELAIYELYQVNLEKPDYSNFENYVISRMGKTLYETYVKHYNLKQWQIHPREMDAEWARFRPLTLRLPTQGMFGDKWQGHPGNYNPMWSGMLGSARIIYGEAKVSEDFQQVTVNGDHVDADVIVSTLPLSDELDFMSACMVYVGIKSEKVLMPSYVTSFPNNYSFVRVMEYRQQFAVDSEYTLLDFQFPWRDQCHTDDYIEQTKSFACNILKQEVGDLWVDSRARIYPVSTKKNLDLVERQLDLASKSKVIPLGRCGVHAYVSKDTCIRMALIMSENLDSLLSGDDERKKAILLKMREKLT